MANTINPRPLEPVLRELKEKGFSDASIRLFRDIFVRNEKVLTDKGEIQAIANVTGRTEQLSSTLQNVTSAGQLSSTDAIAADGTGSPLTGGKRGFVALDTNNRLANSFRATAVIVSNTPTSSTTLSNDGVSTAIPISAYTSQYPPSTVSYNSGSVDPGGFGGVFIYFDDPTFSGGAVTYQFTSTASVQTAAEGRSIVGQITTVLGTAKTGGGSSGGTGGHAGGRGFING